MLELEHLIQPVTLVLLTIVGWGVRAIWSQGKENDRKLDMLSQTLRSEMQNYTHKETCRAHREGIQAQIDALRQNKEPGCGN